MKISLTGASGFIGKKICNLLLKKGYELQCLTRRINSNSQAKLYEGDLRVKSTNLEQFVSNTTVLFHCAGELSKVSEMRSTHVQGVKNLLEVIEQDQITNPKLIFHWIQLSSCGAYGQNSERNHLPRYIDEETPNNPDGEYEITKTEADDLIIEFASNHDWFKYTIIRPSIVFGPGMKSKAIKSVAKLLKLRIFICIEKGSIANYVHVDDVVSAMFLSMMNEKAFNKTFIVSNDCNMSDFIYAICKGLGIGKPLLSINISLINFFANVLDLLKLGNPMRRKMAVLNRKVSYSNASIKKGLGWEPSDVRAQISEYVKSAI